MLKLVGFVIGSVLSSAALWFAIGGPLPIGGAANPPGAPRLSEQRLALPRPEPVVPPVVDEAGMLGVAAAVEPPSAPELAAEFDPVPETRVPDVPEEVVVEAPEPSPGSEQPRNDAAQAAPPAEAVSPDAPAPDRALADVAADAASDRAWHPVWQPFHSELSARGFAHRLERLTGLDYRVDRVAFDSFQVSVAYRDDADLDATVARISSATGLTLSPPGALP